MKKLVAIISLLLLVVGGGVLWVFKPDIIQLRLARLKRATTELVRVQPKSSFTETQTQEVEKIVHDYLVNHPQVLFEMDQKLREMEIAERAKKLADAKSKIIQQLPSLLDPARPGSVVLGNPQGKTTILEFTQHQCPACRRASAVVGKVVKEHPDVRLVAIYWPFFGNDAAYAAQAVLAASQQQLAPALDELFFSSSEPLTKSQIQKLIGSLVKLDAPALFKAMQDPVIANGLKDNFRLAKELGFSGTPGIVVVNGESSKAEVLPGFSPTFESNLLKAIQEVTP